MKKEHSIFDIISEEVMNYLIESKLELSSIDASEFLKLVKRYDPENENHYKSVIFNKTLLAAKEELSKKLNTTVQKIDNAIGNKESKIKSGNPKGIGGAKEKKSTENHITPILLSLDDYNVDSIKEKINKLSDKKFVDFYFTWEVFDLINKAALRLAERHNNQVNVIENGEINYIDPYTNTPITNTDNAIFYKGAYYNNKTSYNKSRQLHNPKEKTNTSIKKLTIAGLRWIYSNAKHCA